MQHSDLKGVIISLLATVALMVGGVVSPANAAESRKIINFITTPPGTANYTISVSQGQLITRKTDIKVIVQPVQGAKIIPPVLESGDAQVSDLSSLAVHGAYTGTGDFTKPFRFIRAFQSGDPSYFGLVTKDKTGIKSIADLKGKRIAYAFTSTITRDLLETEAEAYGLNPAKDMTILKVEDSVTGLRDLEQGRVDAVSCSLGGSKMAEFAAKMKLVLLPFEADKIHIMKKRLPAILSAVTPNNLSGVDPGVPVVYTPMLFIGRADLSDALVYKMVKTVMENYDDLKVVNPVMAGWKPEVAVRELTVPYHPGAIKYYKEKGFWSAKMDQVQKKSLEK